MGLTSSLAALPAELFRALLSWEPPDRSLADRAREIGSAAGLDWQALTEESSCHGIGLLVYCRLKELGLEGVLPPETVRAWASDSRHSDLQCMLQRREALLISQVLVRLGIPHAVLKGTAYREWLYRPTWIRPASDIDILIDPLDIETVRTTMHEIGFVQASRSCDFRNFRPATAREIRETEAKHHELAQFARSLRLVHAPDWLFDPDFRRGAPFTFEQLPDGPVVHSVVDIHWALHFFWADESPLEHVVTIADDADGFEIPTLSPAWSLLFSSFKLYFESFDHPGRGLHKLIDLAALLRAFHREIDWSWYQGMVQRYQIQAASFYTLSAAERVAGAALVPEDLMREWSRIERPATRHREWREEEVSLDFGDFLPSLFKTRLPAEFLATVRAADAGNDLSRL